MGIVGAAVIALRGLRRVALAPGLTAAFALTLVAVPLLAAYPLGTSVVDKGQGRTQPAFVDAEAQINPRVGTLQITPQADGGIRAAVVRGTGAVLNQQSTLENTDQTPTANQRELAALAGNLASRSGLNSAQGLADFGIRFVVLQVEPGAENGVLTSASPAAAATAIRTETALDGNAALAPVGDTNFGRLWQHEATSEDPAASQIPANAGGLYGLLVTLAALVVIGVTVLLSIPTGAGREAVRQANREAIRRAARENAKQAKPKRRIGRTRVVTSDAPVSAAAPVTATAVSAEPAGSPAGAPSTVAPTTASRAESRAATGAVKSATKSDAIATKSATKTDASAAKVAATAAKIAARDETAAGKVAAKTNASRAKAEAVAAKRAAKDEATAAKAAAKRDAIAARASSKADAAAAKTAAKTVRKEERPSAAHAAASNDRVSEAVSPAGAATADAAQKTQPEPAAAERAQRRAEPVTPNTDRWAPPAHEAANTEEPVLPAGPRRSTFESPADRLERKRQEAFAPPQPPHVADEDATNPEAGSDTPATKPEATDNDQ